MHAAIDIVYSHEGYLPANGEPERKSLQSCEVDLANQWPQASNYYCLAANINIPWDRMLSIPSEG